MVLYISMRKIAVRVIWCSAVVLLLLGVSLPWMIPILYNAVFGPFELSDVVIQSALQDEKTAASRGEGSYLPVNKKGIASIFRLGCFRDGMKFYFKAPETFYTINYTHFGDTPRLIALEKYCKEIYQTDIGYILSVGTYGSILKPQASTGFIVNFDKKNIQYMRTDVYEGKVLLWKTDPDMIDATERAAYIENPEGEILPIAFYNRI